MTISAWIRIIVMGICDCLDLLVFICNSEGDVGLALNAVIVRQIDKGRIVRVVVV